MTTYAELQGNKTQMKGHKKLEQNSICLPYTIITFPWLCIGFDQTMVRTSFPFCISVLWMMRINLVLI